MTHIIVITAAAGISDAQIAALSGAAGAAAIRLDDTAAEAPGDVAGLSRARVALGAAADANLTPAANRRKRLLIADMDSTIISVECIDEIADFAGVKAEVSAITEAAMRGELDFDGALKARVALLRGLPEGALQRTYDERVRLNPGARALVETMNRAGALTALVSGGFTFFTDRVGAAAGFAVSQANTLLIEDGALTGAPGLPILGRQAKLDTMLRLCAERGLTAGDVIAVGDGANDMAMIEAAGLGVAYRAKPALEAAAQASLRVSDLSALLHLQGYRGAEIARD
jgi:phosphoserine phosphatase